MESDFVWCEKRSQRIHYAICDKLQPCWRKKKNQCDSVKLIEAIKELKRRLHGQNEREV